MNEDDALLFVAALVKRLGGKVTLSYKELMDARDLTIYRSEDEFSFTPSIKFAVEDGTVIQGVLV